MKHTWTIPALIAVLTFAGLIGGLIADGMGDVLAWISLLIPALVAAQLFKRRPHPPARQRGAARRAGVEKPAAAQPASRSRA